MSTRPCLTFKTDAGSSLVRYSVPVVSAPSIETLIGAALQTEMENLNSHHPLRRESFLPSTGRLPRTTKRSQLAGAGTTRTWQVDVVSLARSRTNQPTAGKLLPEGSGV